MSLRGLQEDQNPSTIPLSNAMLYFPHDTRAVNVGNRTSQPSVTALVRFVTARASLSTHQRMSGLPLRHVDQHFKRI